MTTNGKIILQELQKILLVLLNEVTIGYQVFEDVRETGVIKFGDEEVEMLDKLMVMFMRGWDELDYLFLCLLYWSQWVLVEELI